MSKFQPGDRVALAAKFLKDTRQFTGNAAQRRGTFAGYWPGMEKTHGFVHWDDEAEMIASGKGQYAEQDYCDHVRTNGSGVALSAIAKVGSARFACNDL